MEPILEFKTNFSNKEYYIYVQIKKDSIYITIETDEESEILYWRKNLENQTIKDTTSQMGSFKSLEAFSEMLIAGLSKKDNLVSIDFCSLNEIRELAGNESPNIQNENNIKKYLVIMNNKYERIVYPIQMDYLGPNGTIDLLKNTIRRIRKNKNNNENIKKLNYNLLIEREKNEKLKKDNENLNTKIKLLNEGRQLGAVDNDDIYKNYSELQEKYETYKMTMENKIKSLNKTIEELKETQFKESQTNFHKNELKRNKIQDLQQKINQNSEAFYQESKQYAKIIEERNREIENLQKEIRKYIENERQMKVKISNLEKDLEKEKRESNYYRYGSYTPKTTKSYKSNYSGSSYKNSLHNSNKRSYSNTNTSYLKKNLIPSKYKYRVYKPIGSTKYSYYGKNRYGNSSLSNKSSKYSKNRKSYGSEASTSSKGKYNSRKNYVSPYRYNKGASPYRYAVNNKIRNSNSRSNSKNNSNKNSINSSKKKNSPFKISKTNYTNTIGHNYKIKIDHEVKKNNYISTKESNNKYINNKYSNNKYTTNNKISNNNFNKNYGNYNKNNNKKDNDYKSIKEKLSNIQNLLNQANKK